jgi:hypothetical protein
MDKSLSITNDEEITLKVIADYIVIVYLCSVNNKYIINNLKKQKQNEERTRV